MLLAFALAAVGYVLAFRSPEPDLGDEESFSVGIGAFDHGESAASGPLALTYRPGPARILQLEFLQADTSGAADISTDIEAEVYEKRMARPDGEGVRYQRTYRRVGVSIEENGEPIGETITDQIETMLVSAEEVVEIDPAGRPKDFSWESLSNPQVRQTLRMLRHAMILLHPRPRRGEINVGERWSYRMPAKLLRSEYISAIEGDIRIREKWADAVVRDGKNLAVIERTFEVRAEGSAELYEAEGAREFKLTGSGSGRAYFDAEAGVVVESRLEIERTLQLGTGEGGTKKRSGRIELIMREKPTPARD